MATITKGMLSDTINGIKINSSIKCNSDNYENFASRAVKYVVMHYTGNKKDLAKSNANYFTSPNRNASAHFFVDDTSIYQSIELRDKAWHCGGGLQGSGGHQWYQKCLNSNSIGIEMCCTAGNYKISKKTLENSAYLCAHLCKMIGITASTVDSYVIRHYDVTGKDCPAQMVKNSAEWTAFKKMVKDILNSGTVSTSTGTSSTTTTTSKPATSATTATKLTVDGSWGKATTLALQKHFGTTQDGIVSGQPKANRTYLPGVSTSSWEFVSGKATGSNMICKLQKLIGAEVDGMFGKNGVKCLQTYLKKQGFYTGSIDSSCGTNTVKALQNWLNKQ